MRLLAVALLTLVVALIVGYEPSVTPTFGATFPDRPTPGGINLAPLRVTLHDLTHLVTGLEVIDPRIPGSFSGDGVVRVDGQPNAVRVNWTGGACESGVTAVFLATEAGYRLAMRANPTLGGLLGCPAVGVPRSFELRFRERIAPERISLKSPYGPPNIPYGSPTLDTSALPR